MRREPCVPNPAPADIVARDPLCQGTITCLYLLEQAIAEIEALRQASGDVDDLRSYFRQANGDVTSIRCQLTSVLEVHVLNALEQAARSKMGRKGGRR